MSRFLRPMMVASIALCMWALPPGLDAQDPTEDPLFSTLFTPEEIMQHRRAIGLTDEQQDAISRLIQDLQGRVVSLQWELLDEVQELTALTSEPRVGLDSALDRLDGVLDTEREIKRAHLEMLLRIKNLLEPAQQEELAGLRVPPTGSGGG